MQKVIINEVLVSYFEVASKDQYTPFNVLLNLKDLSEAFGIPFSKVLDVLDDRPDYLSSTNFQNDIPYLPVPYCQGMCMILTAKRSPYSEAIIAAHDTIYEEFLQRPGKALRNQPQFLN